LRRIQAGVLEIAFRDNGSPDGWPVILSHGFPFDVHAYDEVVPLLTARGARAIVPYLRGYGPTRFLSPDTSATFSDAVLTVREWLQVEASFSA